MQYSYASNRWAQRLFSAPISLVILTSLVLATIVVHAQSPDFALSATPSNLCVNPGVNAAAVINLQSVDGFAGTVSLASSVDPNVNDAPPLSPIPSSETLTPGQGVSFNLAISTTTSTQLYTYSISVSGVSGATFHQTIVQLTVAAGCSVGGVVLPTAAVAPTTSFVVYGLVIAGLVGVVATTLAIYVSRRKPISNP